MQRPSNQFPWRVLLLALGAYTLVEGAFLGLGSVHTGVEAREAIIVDSIMRSGDWLLAGSDGQAATQPGLYHWAGAVSGIAHGGFSELGVRLPSLCAALGLLACCALAGFGVARISRTTESDLHCERVALFSAGILSLCYGFQQLTVQARGDMVLSLCVWGALAALVLAGPNSVAQSEAISSRNRALFWLFCSLAALAGGLRGFLLPVGLAALGGCWLVGLPRTARELLTPSLGWLALGVPLCMRSIQLVARDGSGLPPAEVAATGSWWFCMASLLRNTFPWGFIMLVLSVGVFPWRRTVSYSGQRGQMVSLPLAVLVLGVAAFTLVGVGRHASLLPLYPLVAIGLALALSMRIERGGAAIRERLWGAARKAEVVLALLGVLVLVVAGLALHGDWSPHPLEDVVKFAFGPFAVRLGAVLLVVLVAVVAIQRRSASVLYCTVWMLMVTVMTILVAAGAVLKSSLTGFSSMSEQLLLLLKPGQEVAIMADPADDYFAPIVLYLHRPVRVIAPGRGEAACDPGLLYVARRAWLERHETLVPGSLREVAVLQETAHALLRDGVRELVVFTCAPSAFPNDRGERRWHDA